MYIKRAGENDCILKPSDFDRLVVFKYGLCVFTDQRMTLTVTLRNQCLCLVLAVGEDAKGGQGEGAV